MKYTTATPLAAQIAFDIGCIKYSDFAENIKQSIVN